MKKYTKKIIYITSGRDFGVLEGKYIISNGGKIRLWFMLWDDMGYSCIKNGTT